MNGDIELTRELNEVVVIDAVRTAFGRAGEKGLFWNTRAEDLCVPLLKALLERNPSVTPAMIEDSIWGGAPTRSRSRAEPSAG